MGVAEEEEGQRKGRGIEGEKERMKKMKLKREDEEKRVGRRGWGKSCYGGIVNNG